MLLFLVIWETTVYKSMSAHLHCLLTRPSPLPLRRKSFKLWASLLGKKKTFLGQNSGLIHKFKKILSWQVTWQTTYLARILAALFCSICSNLKTGNWQCCLKVRFLALNQIFLALIQKCVTCETKNVHKYSYKFKFRYHQANFMEKSLGTLQGF